MGKNLRVYTVHMQVTTAPAIIGGTNSGRTDGRTNSAATGKAATAPCVK